MEPPVQPIYMLKRPSIYIYWSGPWEPSHHVSWPFIPQPYQSHFEPSLNDLRNLFLNEKHHMYDRHQMYDRHESLWPYRVIISALSGHHIMKWIPSSELKSTFEFSPKWQVNSPQNQNVLSSLRSKYKNMSLYLKFTSKLNSLWPNDTICQHRSRPTLFHVISYNIMWSYIVSLSLTVCACGQLHMWYTT